jgi:NRAMP (natural resistance-associated macrophage protein)-like metal ion transporter
VPVTRRRPRDRPTGRTPEGWRGDLKALGPGLITGASDDDPSGIATYAQAGAKLQYGLVWTVLFTFPLMTAVQEMCDRTALATGKGLGELTVKRFGPVWRVVIGILLAALVVANALNIAADLLAIGSGMELLHLGPASLWAAAAGVAITVLVASGSFSTIAKVLRLLCGALLAYLVVLAFADVPWGTVLAATLRPRLSTESLPLLIAVLGTTISPYLFFWQSANRIEELREEPSNGSRATTLRERTPRDARIERRRARLDVFSGMAFSNIVMFAIIVATGATLGANGATTIDSAAQAAQALRPVAGSLASTLFALGFIGAGMLAVPVLAGSASSAIAGMLGRPWGFSNDVGRAPVFYGLVAVGTLGGTLLSFIGVNPIQLLVVVAVVNGVAAAPFLLVVLLIANDTSLMGDNRNGPLSNVLGFVTVVAMTLAAVAFFLTGGN